ncbi:hypothetical protein BDW02DRAFT_492158 [Decorospora gaudefroyi]|uniref:Uncharacterized protein n=1 Tax=Decorospora gaudefroyi TaxID=184978 RepID=A0A6A5KPX8_9PLEO|nr:hypothetical protein BDW02DRAFT_492158 [Decorospora gaudefroyi]
MIKLQDLTVGQVSGIIAAAVFVVQILVPIALPVILLGLLRPRSAAATQTAVSWSVIGRFLHSSLWPLFVHADSAATFSACKTAIFAVFFKGFILALIAIAAIVTPLGLYDGIIADGNPAATVFNYIKDTSPMGYGTPPRILDTTWSRLCGDFLLVPCPNDYNNATVINNNTGIYTDYEADWYDSRIPPNVVDVFQSGIADLEQSMSSFFDIQYRTYMRTLIDDKGNGPVIDNATARTVGTYQPLSSMLLNDDVIPIEGLIVDMKNGGLGFRNHSAPTWRKYGSTWVEDITFIVPETVCVDTNLTLDFMIPRTQTEYLTADSEIFRLEITDRGGFVNLNTTYPAYQLGDVQGNPNLWYRAYRAAWLRNAYTMAYMNVTSLNNGTTGDRSFTYLDSELNKTFPLYFPSGEVAPRYSIQPQSLSVVTRFGDYLDGTEGVSNVSTIGNETTTFDFESTLPLYPNPFDISFTDWDSIDTLCRGQGPSDLANITHIIAKCGVLNGAPRRNDGSASILFDPGSSWTMPMYTCISTAKATIRTVKFQFNGTANDLSSLKVISSVEKTYPDDESKPLWGVEKSDMELRNGGPLWGIVSEEKAKTLNISTVRSESLYLPGRDATIKWQNLPAADFASIALQMAYDTGSVPTTQNPVDYSGKSNLAMFKKWQELSRDPSTSAQILNLIWTDIAANLVVGTKGLHEPENAKRKRDGEDTSARRTPSVTSYTRRVKYHYAYGIPAFFALALAFATLLSTIYFMIFSGAKPSTMRTFLQHTSAGRFLTAQSSGSALSHTTHSSYAPPSQQDGYSNAPTKIWLSGAGKHEFALGPEGWMKNAQGAEVHTAKGGANVSYAPVARS